MRFLSDEWIAAMVDAVGAVEAPAGTTIRVAHELTDVTEGVRRWVLACEGGRCTFDVGDEPADVWFESTLDVAEALARGELSPSPAVLHGDIRLRGDTQRLLAASDLLAALGPATAAVGARLDAR